MCTSIFLSVSSSFLITNDHTSYTVIKEKARVFQLYGVTNEKQHSLVKQYRIYIWSGPLKRMFNKLVRKMKAAILNVNIFIDWFSSFLCFFLKFSNFPQTFSKIKSNIMGKIYYTHAALDKKWGRGAEAFPFGSF